MRGRLKEVVSEEEGGLQQALVRRVERERWAGQLVKARCGEVRQELDHKEERSHNEIHTTQPKEETGQRKLNYRDAYFNLY